MAKRPFDDCVHCGFCLPACPTWNNWSNEADSPRGRIDLARALADGRAEMGPAVARHFDRCLGCMGCMSACPSGVRYDRVLFEMRARVEAESQRPRVERLFRALVFALFPHPRRLRLAAMLLWLLHVTGLQALARATRLLRLLPRLARLDALAPAVTLRHVVASLPAVTPARGPRRMRVGLVGGCVQRVFFPEVNLATLRVLSAEGIEVVVPQGQGCCGALSAHAGRHREAAQMARSLVSIFEDAGVEVVVTNAAGCGSHLKHLADLFDDDAFAARARALSAKVVDVTELLAALPAVASRGRVDGKVAYHSACHLGHAQGVVEPPRALLRAIPGLEVVEIPNGDECCGSAGVYNLVEDESATQIGRRKADNVLATGADVLASANPGCTLHIQRMLADRGASVRALHPIEILDAAIRAAKDG